MVFPKHPVFHFTPMLHFAPTYYMCQLTHSSLADRKKTLFKVGQCKQYDISSHMKWVLVADKACTSSYTIKRT